MEEPLDTKVAVVLLEELPVWQKANVAAFLVSGIAGSAPRLVGEAYVDGSGNRYMPMLRQPILIYAADSSGIRRADERAMAREVEELSIFTRELFSTPHDEANRAAVAAVPAAELDLVGIALRADRKIVDKGTRQAATTFVTPQQRPDGGVSPVCERELGRRVAVVLSVARPCLCVCEPLLPADSSDVLGSDRRDRIASIRRFTWLDNRLFTHMGGLSMSWNLKGSYVETCSCDLICPCNATFDHGATYDFCRVVLVFNIREGEIEGTEIGGLKVAAIADTPKVMTDGNWRLGMFIDERATDEQADKLTQVFGGQLGGPMSALAPLVGEMLGVERAAIEVQDDGVRHSVRIGDVIDFEIKDIVPFGIETGEPVRFAGMFHPVASDLTIAEATRSRINAFGIEYEGKTGLSTSEFSWAA